MLAEVFSVFTQTASWFTTSVPSVVELFWDSELKALTFLGVLSVAGLSISVFFLLLGVIQNFLHFRG